MKSVQTLNEELKYSKAMLLAYDGEDKEVRIALRSNIEAIQEKLRQRGFMEAQAEN